MDWQRLFLSPDGRIGRQDFWIGWAILFGANLVLTFIPLIGQLFHLFAIYVYVCLSAKRLHDMGRSGWLQIAPWVVTFVGFLMGFALFGSALITAALTQRDPGALPFVLGGVGGLMMIFSLIGLVHLAFLIWIGATPGQVGENLYGPDPKAANTADVF